jgi:hypothetical protein
LAQGGIKFVADTPGRLGETTPLLMGGMGLFIAVLEMKGENRNRTINLMDEATHRKWNIIFKWFSLFAVLASGWWTVYKYREDRFIESAQRQEQRKRDDEARAKDQNSYVFQHQATLYFDTARAAATLATALDPNASDRNAIDANTLKDARIRFAQLYWGELVITEDRRVELAVIAFQRCLLKKGVRCERVEENQYRQPIDTKKLAAETAATLQTLSLEIGACMRTALQDRDIQFGNVKSAITLCPYN